MDEPSAVSSCDRVIAVLNGKGGVGKTSIVSNLAGQLAAAGLSTLAVDLDLSGNLALDLGYTDTSDDGRGLVQALMDTTPLPRLAGVRPGLDVIAGGRYLEMLAGLAGTPMAEDLPGGGVGGAFAHALAAMAGQYEFIVLDCAPGNPVLQDLALAATRYVLVPTKSDAAGWDGLRMIGPRVRKARETNPEITYLGVLIFGHSTNATRILQNTRTRLAQVSDTIPLLDTYIRHSESAAHDCRRRGQLAHELAADATDQHLARLRALRSRRASPGAATPLPAGLSGTADSLAGDYERLTREILHRIQLAEQSTDRGQGNR